MISRRAFTLIELLVVIAIIAILAALAELVRWHVHLIRSAPLVPPRIPTGFRPPAQGCDAGATLGSRPTGAPNPNGVVANPHPLLRARLWTQPRWG